MSWELDDAEAPGRVRVRLRRAHLSLRPRFLQPNHQYKTGTSHRPYTRNNS